MKMKQPIVIVAALTLSFTAQAQSLEEGIKMYNYERYESAKKQLAPLAGSNPVANYYLGLSELKQGNVNAAQGIFTKYPENYANIAGTAMVSFAQGKAAEGNQIAQGLASKAKKKEWEQLKYAADAVTISEGGNKQQAVDWYKEVQTRSGKNTTELLIAMGDAYNQMQTGGGQAVSNYEKAVEMDPNNSLALSRLGSIWYAARRYDLALENWKKASTADPSNPLPYRDMASAYAASGKYDLALQNIEKYYELSDKNTEDKIAYMDILYLSKSYDKAVKMAQELIDAGVTNPRIYGLMGFSQFELKDYAKALDNARIFFGKQNAKKIYPSDYINFGRMFLQNNMPDSAEFYFSKAIGMDTTTQGKTALYREIGEGFKSAKNYAQSAIWYQRAAEQADATPTDYFWTGAMHYYAHNYPTAAKWFEQMETKYPEQPSAPYWRGRVAAAVDSMATEGTAVPHYTKWLGIVGPGYDKKTDLMYAYQYLALYHYNKEDKANTTKYLELIEAIEPGNALAKQIREALKNLKGANKSSKSTTDSKG